MFRLTIFALLCAFSSVGITDTTPINLTFGTYSDDRPSALVRQIAPVVKAVEFKMEQNLNRNVSIKIAITRTEAEAIGYLNSGHFDFVRFGSASYLYAENQNSSIELVAKEAIEDGKTFYGIIATQGSNGLTDIDQIVGSNFAFGSEGSTVGRYLAQQYLTKKGIFSSDLKSFQYLGRHDSVGIAVANGEYDAGALQEATFNELRAAGYNIVELDRYEDVANSWVASSQVDPEILAALKEGLLSITDKKLLSRLNIYGFMEVDAVEYDPIRKSIEQNSEFFK